MNIFRGMGRVRTPQLVMPTGFDQARGSAKFLLLALIPAALCIAVVALEMPLYLKATLLCALLGVALFFAILVLPMRGAPDDVVRLSEGESLRFASPSALNLIWVSMACIALSGLLATFDMFLAGALGIPQSVGLLRYSGPAVLALGVAGLFGALRGLRKPTGLTLSQDGVLGNGSLVAPIHIPWSDLAGVTLATEGKIKVVQLHDSRGDILTLKPVLLGSDPVIIAETIEYFRTHPQDREKLTSPLEALRLVADVA